MSQSGNEPYLGIAYIILYLRPMFVDDQDYEPDAGPRSPINVATVYYLFNNTRSRLQ